MNTKKVDGFTVKNICNRFQHSFAPGVCSLHNLLWQIIINEACCDKHTAITAIVGNNGACELVLAKDSGGYIPTGVEFLKNVAYSGACDVAEELDRAVFGHGDAGIGIVTASMRSR